MSRSKSRKMADLMSGGTFDDGVVAASEVTGLHTVATSGSFNDLSDQPSPFDPSTLGTASTQATGDFATAAQGALAATALQSSSSLEAANLTGTLPAIDGSALTGVGGSTTFGAVGTYIYGAPKNAKNWAFGETSSGLYAVREIGETSATPDAYAVNTSGIFNDAGQQAVSGTWRHMGGCGTSNSGSTYFMAMGIWVRIS